MHCPTRASRLPGWEMHRPTGDQRHAAQGPRLGTLWEVEAAKHGTRNDVASQCGGRLQEVGWQELFHCVRTHIAALHAIGTPRCNP